MHDSSFVVLREVWILVYDTKSFLNQGLLQSVVVLEEEDDLKDPEGEAQDYKHKRDPVAAIYFSFATANRLDIEQAIEQEKQEGTVNEGQNSVATGFL